MNKMNSKKVALINMAFGAGSESKESQGFDKYVGIAPFFVKGVNLTMAEMKALYPDRNYEKEFDYSYNKEGEAKGTFVTFLLETNADHKDANGILFNTRASYLIKDEIYWNKDKTKVQVINDFGDTIWMTKEEFQSKTLPEYAVKQSYITQGMRPAYVGEEGLINFLKMFINIPNSRNYNRDAGWTPKTGEDLKAAECGFSLEDIKKIIHGDVSVVRNAIKLQPTNQIKMLCGVRTSSDNREYQEVCTRLPIRFGMTDYKKVDADLQRLKDNGAYANSNFGTLPYTLQVYKVDMTDFTNSGNTGTTPIVDPFADFQ